MRNALAIAVRDFFGQLPGGAVSDLSPADVDWLAACATFGSHARSPIHQLSQGLSRIGANRQQARNVIRSAMLGSIPKQRRLALTALLDAQEPLRTAQVAARTGTGLQHPAAARRPRRPRRYPLQPRSATLGPQFWTPTADIRQLWAVITGIPAPGRTFGVL
jgi:hypothetical protein